MSNYPSVASGNLITGNYLRGFQTNVIIKQATETVTNSTTMQDDDELIVPVEANATYQIRFHLIIGGVAAGDIKTEYTVPSGASGFKYCQGPQVGMADRENTAMVSAVHGFGTDRAYGTVSTATSPAVIEELIVITGSTAGNVTLRWAQNTANATGSIIAATSFVSWTRVG